MVVGNHHISLLRPTIILPEASLAMGLFPFLVWKSNPKQAIPTVIFNNSEKRCWWPVNMLWESVRLVGVERVEGAVHMPCNGQVGMLPSFTTVPHTPWCLQGGQASTLTMAFYILLSLPLFYLFSHIYLYVSSYLHNFQVAE